MSGTPGASSFQTRFDVVHGSVAEAAVQAAAQARRSGPQPNAEALQIIADEIQRSYSIGAFGDAAALECQRLPAIDGQADRAGQADERITAEASPPRTDSRRQEQGPLTSLR